MDILTTVKLDHKNIDAMLEKLIDSIKEGKINHILLEDTLEEITEHVQAEKVCLSEMLCKKEAKIQPSSTINKENILKILTQKLYEGNLNIRDKDLENKLNHLRTYLFEHSNYMENVIQQLMCQGISDEESEKLCAKFEKEKINTLRRMIAYA